MNRLRVVAALALLTVTSCASTWYSVKPITATVPSADNAASSCAVTPELCPVAPGTPRVMHLRWAQGGLTVREDSLSAGAGATVTWPAITVPGSGLVTLTGWASDAGGVGCPVTLTLTPFAVGRPPAAPTLVVAP